MLVIRAFFGLLCWVVSNAESYCYSCDVLYCSCCSYYGVCYICEDGFTLVYEYNVCEPDSSSTSSRNYYTPSPNTEPSYLYEEKEDDSSATYLGLLLVTVLVFSVLFAVVYCGMRRHERAFTPSQGPYISHRVQRIPPTLTPHVSYFEQGWNAEPNMLTAPATYYPIPTEPTNASSNTNQERPRETTYVVGPDGELQVGVGRESTIEK